MDRSELNKLCQQANAEGALWRLVRVWDPDMVQQWVLAEKRNSTINPYEMINCVAEVCSGAAFVVAQNLTGDRAQAILGTRGLVAQMRASVEHKLNQVGGAHKILKPNGGVHYVPPKH